MSSKIRITTEELPLRPRSLSPGEVSGVFGGCVGFGWPCVQQSDCCAGYTCLASPTEQMQLYILGQPLLKGCGISGRS